MPADRLPLIKASILIPVPSASPIPLHHLLSPKSRKVSKKGVKTLYTLLEPLKTPQTKEESRAREAQSNHMAHTSSPHSLSTSPPSYEKSPINRQNHDSRDRRDPAPSYSLKLETEGNSADDKLPPYAPTLQLLTLCRRKNELDSKDRKAKKRSWDLVWLLLDGTALRMYHPTSSERKKFEKEWKEKYCVKKVSSKKQSPVPVERDEDSEEDADDVEDEEEDSISTVQSTLVEETRVDVRPSLCRGRSSSILKTSVEPLPSQCTSRRLPTRTPPSRPVQPTTTLSPSPRNPQTSPSPTTTALGFSLPPHPNLQSILSRKAHVSHAVRNISCTRATTYFKRHFVLRFVLEDQKQFLVQLNGWEETLVWLQLMTIAAPLALDLDERPMPDPAPYPRPRRRTQQQQQQQLQRRPSTAPGAIDTTWIPNVPPDYQNSPSTDEPTSTPVRRRRSLSGI